MDSASHVPFRARGGIPLGCLQGEILVTVNAIRVIVTFCQVSIGKRSVAPPSLDAIAFYSFSVRPDVALCNFETGAVLTLEYVVLVGTAAPQRRDSSRRIRVRCGYQTSLGVHVEDLRTIVEVSPLYGSSADVVLGFVFQSLPPAFSCSS